MNFCVNDFDLFGCENVARNCWPKGGFNLWSCNKEINFLYDNIKNQELELSGPYFAAGNKCASFKHYMANLIFCVNKHLKVCYIVYCITQQKQKRQVKIVNFGQRVNIHFISSFNFWIPSMGAIVKAIAHWSEVRTRSNHSFVVHIFM